MQVTIKLTRITYNKYGPSPLSLRIPQTSPLQPHIVIASVTQRIIQILRQPLRPQGQRQTRQYVQASQPRSLPEELHAIAPSRNVFALSLRKRANSTDLSSKKVVELEGIGSYRYGAKGNIEQGDKGIVWVISGNRSKMASVGNSLLRNSSMDQTQVYKRQEKEFNIINFYQKEYKPNLRQFPKLTV